MKLTLKTIGADPEFFIRRKRDGVFVPSSLITSGTKEKPESTGTEGFFVHKDNLTVEGNIPPAWNKEEFVGSMKFLKEIIRTLAEIKGCELVCDDEAVFKPRFINTEDAKDFGCSNYKIAWANPAYSYKSPSLCNNIRVAAGHIHIGYKATDVDGKMSLKYIKQVIARAFDLFLTYPSDQIKYSKYRRSNYGKYGAYRETSYGLECRSLGSYFMQDKYLPWIYDQVVKMFDWLNSDDNFNKLYLEPNRYYTNQNNIKTLIDKFKIKEIVECTI